VSGLLAVYKILTFRLLLCTKTLALPLAKFFETHPHSLLFSSTGCRCTSDRHAYFLFDDAVSCGFVFFYVFL
jgi:hypothetical protein